MPSNKSVSDAPITQFINCRILRDHKLQRYRHRHRHIPPVIKYNGTNGSVCVSAERTCGCVKAGF